MSRYVQKLSNSSQPVLSELQDLAEKEQRSISNLAALLVQVGLNALAIGEFNTLLLNTAEDKDKAEQEKSKTNHQIM